MWVDRNKHKCVSVIFAENRNQCHANHQQWKVSNHQAGVFGAVQTWNKQCLVWQWVMTSQVCVVLQSVSCADAALCCLKGHSPIVVIFVPLPLCWWHCRNWHHAERCGEYFSSGASICHPWPRLGLSHDAVQYMGHCTVVCVAEVVTVLSRQVHDVLVLKEIKEQKLVVVKLREVTEKWT